MGVKDGHDHFDRGAGVVDVALWVAIVADCRDQILDRHLVACLRGAIGERFGLTEAGTRNILPGRVATPAIPGGIGQEPRARQIAGLDLDDAAGAADRQTESRAWSGADGTN